jgi:IS5 family transposase
LVSLFDEHAGIIVRGSRNTEYGHKLNLTTGKHGMILDLVIDAGNPADSDRLLPMLERHVAFYGRAPRQAAADGGFATHNYLSTAKAWGVSDMAFNKKAGLRIEDMVRSKWVYRKLSNFRADIEASISCLKRAYGLARCTWRGLDHFKSYVWSSVVAYNLVLFTRLKAA